MEFLNFNLLPGGWVRWQPRIVWPGLGVVSITIPENKVMPHLTGEEGTLSPRFRAFAVTLAKFAGGEYLPFPRSKGGAFPFLLTLSGYPTAPSNFARGQGALRGTSSLGLKCYVSPLITEGLHNKVNAFLVHPGRGGSSHGYC
jgi:hypothetical protein